jgi:hypothetical protein
VLVVVGGHSRNVGKTSVVCGLIRQLPELHWTAIKITQYGHGVCSQDGKPCECKDPLHPVMLSAETGAKPATDSGRYLAAGARRAFWLRTAAGDLAEALPRLRVLLAEGGNFIVESNSLIHVMRPDLYILVVDGANPDFKPSCRRVLDRVDVVADTSGAPWRWEGVPAALLISPPRYFAPAPGYENAGLASVLQNLYCKNEVR